MPRRTSSLTLGAVAGTLALALAGCSSSAVPTAGGTTSATATASTVQVEDNTGTQTVTVPPSRVVATDNRLFETLADWGVELAAAPVDLIPTTIAYRTDASVVNLGTHNEPDLEAVVAAQPDLVLNGQRFQQYGADLATLVPDAAIVDTTPRDGEPLDAELKRQVEVLGQIFDREDDAQALVDEFDAAVARVKAAYDPATTVMSVITSGGEINYAAPGSGRTLGPVYDILGLTPAIEADGSTDHEGDDISVEAIAASDPGLILVMDRDAATSASTEGAYVPADELLAGSAALQGVTAVREGRIVYMPQDTYTNEGIQTYTEFFESVADALEQA
ncbi:siderophore ABC transporter substrate-binding protein [Cellulomonas marina]|uniref:Iron complex transport system substrate-binding protein n=1 Tax=Cellulomonas marina TaxID=988821 RepID=A0A1I0X8I7_9CELL|nr:ABC transporter substrate-binding protein [Cellulomonas marina]GIG29514.1 iron ABC transporter substrate-binding protein [Cellulomonas marina]SFA97342.1 iron complex transport system substrate-binding protein [Cellulomonas marina]